MQSLYVTGVKLDLLARQISLGRVSLLVSVFFLTGLGCYHLCLAVLIDLLHLVCKQVSVSCSRAGISTDRLESKAGFKTVQGKEWRDLGCLRHLTVAGKLGGR